MTHETNRGSETRRDLHSFARPEQVSVRHVALDLTVSFEKRSIEGRAALIVERVSGGADRLIVDTRDLDIRSVESAQPSIEHDGRHPKPWRAPTKNWHSSNFEF